jgi:hypothetical protein
LARGKRPLKNLGRGQVLLRKEVEKERHSCEGGRGNRPYRPLELGHDFDDINLGGYICVQAYFLLLSVGLGLLGWVYFMCGNESRSSSKSFDCNGPFSFPTGSYCWSFDANIWF